jgi:hypothetical protein
MQDVFISGGILNVYMSVSERYLCNRGFLLPPFLAGYKGNLSVYADMAAFRAGCRSCFIGGNCLPWREEGGGQPRGHQNSAE